jgi:ACR3 family arsenite efflux pump ArsB
MAYKTKGDIKIVLMTVFWFFFSAGVLLVLYLVMLLQAIKGNLDIRWEDTYLSTSGSVISLTIFLGLPILLCVWFNIRYYKKEKRKQEERERLYSQEKKYKIHR